MKRKFLFSLVPVLLAVVFIGCGPGTTASVPEAGTPPPAGGADIDAEKLAAMERAREASKGEVE